MIIISLHGIGNKNHNSMNNNNNFIQRIFNSIRKGNNENDRHHNIRSTTSISKDDMLDTNISPKAMSELSVILIEKFISFSLFYLSFKLVTSTLSTSLKKLLEIINEVKDPSSSSSSTSMNIVPSYIMKFLKPNITLNSYELELLNTMVDPSRIDTTIYDIGGLDNVKRSLFNLFNNNTSINSISTSTSSSSRTLYRPVKSVLLYGPPGCGKCNQRHLIYDT